MLVSQCFAKSLGLYGQRVGCLHLLCHSRLEAERVSSQLELFTETLCNSPPKYGAQIAELVLGDEELRRMWEGELRVMAGRIRELRGDLVEGLKASPHDWSHILEQIGMFALTGLKAQHVEALMRAHHIFMTGDGRISMAGLNRSNVGRVAAAFDEVTRG